MKKIYLLPIALIMLLAFPNAFIKAQGISINGNGTVPDPSAMLDVNSTNKGELMPRMSTAQRDSIVNPALGLFIFNTDCKVVNFNAGTPQNPQWATLNSSNAVIAGVSIVASPAGAICAGTSVTFSATPSQNNLSPGYQWQINGSNVGSNSSTYTNSNLNSGDVVTCILTSSAPCVTGSPATSNAISMLVNIVPTITGTTPAGFCNGSAVTLSASASLGTINWYSVSTGGSSLSTGASFTVSGLTGTTTYYVDATANGCTTGARTGVTATFYPNSPGQPGAITGPTASNFDSVNTYSINALPNTATYAWTVTSGNIVSGQGTTSINVMWGDSSASGGVAVAAVNPCGTSASQSIPVFFGSQTFSYTGSVQSIVFPPWVSSVNITAYGAQGGNGNGTNGGLGGSATGTLAITPGSGLYVFVGGQNGYNGGGSGGNTVFSGGGESDVRQGGIADSNWVIVAGGGGGGSTNGGTGGAGGGGSVCANGAGGGGGTTGGPAYGGPGNPGTCTTGGGAGNSSSGWSGGGGGGGLTSGGGGSLSGGYGNNNGSGGTQGQGGAYGYIGSNCSCGDNAAGGGGGYYGGGGTSTGCCAGGCGGGGSSWASPSMTNLSFTGGVQYGNGQVVISW